MVGHPPRRIKMVQAWCVRSRCSTSAFQCGYCRAEQSCLSKAGLQQRVRLD